MAQNANVTQGNETRHKQTYANSARCPLGVSSSMAAFSGSTIWKKKFPASPQSSRSPNTLFRRRNNIYRLPIKKLLLSEKKFQTLQIYISVLQRRKNSRDSSFPVIKTPRLSKFPPSSEQNFPSILLHFPSSLGVTTNLHRRN